MGAKLLGSLGTRVEDAVFLCRLALLTSAEICLYLRLAVGTCRFLMEPSQRSRKSMPRCNGNLKKLRITAKKSQNRFARDCDIDRGTISNAENGKDIQDITLQKIVDGLSDALGRKVKLDEIVVK
jgi:DNA-binding XRE family transcriptional regulator